MALKKNERSEETKTMVFLTKRAGLCMFTNQPKGTQFYLPDNQFRKEVGADLSSDLTEKRRET